MADIDPRSLALKLLMAVTEGHQSLALAVPEILANAKPEVRARAQALATGTLRDLPRADKLLGHYLRQRPPLVVHNILRLACHELAQDKAAAHGIVHEAVGLTKAAGLEPMAGLVNAVLRNTQRRPAAEWDKLPAGTLPKPLRKRLLATYGKIRTAAFEAAQALEPPLDLTPRNQESAGNLAKTLSGTLLPTGSIRLSRRVQVSAIAGFTEGAFWVQDAAAALPVRVLAPQKGEHVLDLCAAPGGKTLQIAATGARVTAVDLSAERLGRLHENLARTGLVAEVVAHDVMTYQPSAPVDAILLDAPCSATGTLRRHPDLPHARPDPDLAPLLALQAGMIDHAAKLLRPGGRLVYCTCSLLPEEGEAALEAALARHPDLIRDPEAEAKVLADLPEACRLPGGGIRTAPDLWPELGGMDGFYIAAVRKRA